MSAGNDLPELTLSPDSNLILVPTKAEIGPNAEILVNSLLDRMAAKEAYVAVYARIEVEKQALELLRDRAVLGLDGKGETIFGAEVTMRGKAAKWEYHDDTLMELEFAVEQAEQKVKDRKKFLQSMPPDTASAKTGEVLTPAQKVEQGATIVVKLA